MSNKSDWVFLLDGILKQNEDLRNEIKQKNEQYDRLMERYNSVFNRFLKNDTTEVTPTPIPEPTPRTPITVLVHTPMTQPVTTRTTNQRGFHRNFTDDQIREIRSSNETYKVLGERFNVSHATIGNIRKKIIYKQVS